MHAADETYFVEYWKTQIVFLPRNKTELKLRKKEMHLIAID